MQILIYMVYTINYFTYSIERIFPSEDINNYNMKDEKCRIVITMSIASMFLMGTFQILRFIVVSVEDFKSEHVFSGIGFRCLIIIYSTMIVTALLVPFFIYCTNPKFAMMIGCATYTLFLLSLIWPVIRVLYSTSMLFGTGSVLLGTAQGIYLVQNSTRTTISKHCAIYWTIVQISVFLGGTVVYLHFLDEENIEGGIRIFLIWVLIGFAFTSFIFVSLLPNYSEEYSLLKSNHRQRELVQLFFQMNKVIRNPITLLLCIPFFFLGFYIVFMTMNYSHAVGNASHLERPKALSHVVGIFIGIGEVSGGCLLLITAIYINNSYRITKIMIGFVVFTTAHFMVFINLPNEAGDYDTDDISIIEPSAGVILSTSFLLGFADSCFNTQIIETLAVSFPRLSAIIFPVFELFQALGVIAATFLSRHIAFYGVISLLVALSLTTIICYIISESIVKDEEYASDYSRENSSRRTSRPTTSSSGTPKTRSYSFSENTATVSDTSIPTLSSRSTSEEPSTAYVKTTPKDSKISFLATVRQGIENCFRKLFNYPKETSPDRRESVSISGERRTRSPSRVSIVLPNSEPLTPSSANWSDTKLSRSRNSQIPESQEQPGFLKKLMSIPLKVPWLVPGGLKNAGKHPTSDQKPVKPAYPKIKSVTAVSLRNDSSRSLPATSSEQQIGRLSLGDISNKGILR